METLYNMFKESYHYIQRMNFTNTHAAMRLNLRIFAHWSGAGFGSFDIVVTHFLALCRFCTVPPCSACCGGEYAHNAPIIITPPHLILLQRRYPSRPHL